MKPTTPTKTELRVQLNALRIVVKALLEEYDYCPDEGLVEAPWCPDWEHCWHCFAKRALEHPEDFRMQPGTPGK